LICQIFRISGSQVFKEFNSDYKIYREVFENEPYGLELRDLSSVTAEKIFKIILDEKEICYKKQGNEKTDLFIPGSINKLKIFSRKVIGSGNEDVGYRIHNAIHNFENYDNILLQIGKREFRFNQVYVMGILNVTPDSFSDGGLYYNMEQAVTHGISMVDDGADIIDIGGESTRPGAKPVNVDEELNRVIPVIEGILKSRPDTIISVDTSKSKIAEEALKRGALIINDISGLTFDPLMIEIINEYNAAVIIMHIKGTPEDMQQKTDYGNMIKELFNFLSKRSRAASKGGIKNIIIDPGIGFAKNPEQNFEIIKRLDDFKCLGFPILTGISRKSFLGKLLDLDINNRDVPTAITETAAVLNGARIIRTHNVKYGRYVKQLTDKVLSYV
jgi:dihydropteroate synthase